MKSCRFKYRLRWFYSKGAFLVLTWTLLLSLASCSLIYTAPETTLPLHKWWSVFIAAIAIVGALISGVLADVKFVRHTVVRMGFVLLFLSTVVNCLNLLVIQVNTQPANIMYPFEIACSSFTAITFMIGLSLCVGNLLQLGLDQMPDASTSNITSFIAWFVFCVFTGWWINAILHRVVRHCLKLNEWGEENLTLIWVLLEALCIGIVLISDFTVSPRWLIIEPKSPQYLTTICQVLKFAVKHKAPLNRSAFTYWEDNIPSRIDLGKSKYGGPFSTEQVEDVKTILRLLLVSLSMCFLAFSLLMDPDLDYTQPTNCTDYIRPLFTYDNIWCILVATLFTEFVIYPLIGDKFPTILKKIGIISLISAVLSLLCLAFTIGHYYINNEELATKWVVHILYSIAYGLLQQAAFTSVLEFICAQSPYQSRGFLTFYNIALIVNTVFVTRIIQNLDVTYPQFALLSVKTLLCAIGFIIHCATARWYKRRVRDEDYSVQRMVEEVYDRYLTQSEKYDKSKHQRQRQII